MPLTIGRYTISGRLGDEERVRLFQREVDTLARLKHPNIAAIVLERSGTIAA